MKLQIKTLEDAKEAKRLLNEFDNLRAFLYIHGQDLKYPALDELHDTVKKGVQQYDAKVSASAQSLL